MKCCGCVLEEEERSANMGSSPVLGRNRSANMGSSPVLGRNRFAQGEREKPYSTGEMKILLLHIVILEDLKVLVP